MVPPGTTPGSAWCPPRLPRPRPGAMAHEGALSPHHGPVGGARPAVASGPDGRRRHGPRPPRSRPDPPSCPARALLAGPDAGGVRATRPPSRRSRRARRARRAAARPLVGPSSPRTGAAPAAAAPRRPAPSRRARRVRPESGRCGVARAGRARARPGARPPAAPSPHRARRHAPGACAGTPPAARRDHSAGPGSSPPGPDRGRPAPHGAGDVGGRWGSARSRPAVCSAPREARRCRPSRGSCGPPVPTVPGTMRRSDGHPAPLRALRWSLAARDLVRRGRAWCPCRAQGLGAAPRPHQGLGAPGPPVRAGDKEPEGSPTFPRSPARH